MLFEGTIEPIDEEKQALESASKSRIETESSLEEKSVDSLKESVDTKNMELEETDKMDMENFHTILEAHDPNNATLRRN